MKIKTQKKIDKNIELIAERLAWLLIQQIQAKRFGIKKEINYGNAR